MTSPALSPPYLQATAVVSPWIQNSQTSFDSALYTHRPDELPAPSLLSTLLAGVNAAIQSERDCQVELFDPSPQDGAISCEYTVNPAQIMPPLPDFPQAPLENDHAKVSCGRKRKASSDLEDVELEHGESRRTSRRRLNKHQPSSLTSEELDALWPVFRTSSLRRRACGPQLLAIPWRSSCRPSLAGPLSLCQLHMPLRVSRRWSRRPPIFRRGTSESDTEAGC
jgi:hypothetical protein